MESLSHAQEGLQRSSARGRLWARPGLRRRVFPGLRVAWLPIARMASALRLWRQRSRQRRTLAELDERLLRDIGVNRLAARQECNKWFWQA
jgi:uncharacterized protein YjiS (DUF1127 family)